MWCVCWCVCRSAWEGAEIVSPDWESETGGLGAGRCHSQSYQAAGILVVVLDVVEELEQVMVVLVVGIGAEYRKLAVPEWQICLLSAQSDLLQDDFSHFLWEDSEICCQWSRIFPRPAWFFLSSLFLFPQSLEFSHLGRGASASPPGSSTSTEISWRMRRRGWLSSLSARPCTARQWPGWKVPG